MLELEERVKNGMSFLDLHMVGWMNKVDVENLEMSSVCILHYTHGCYCIGVDEYDLSIDQRLEYGFSCHERTHEYPALTEAWKRAILQRRKEEADEASLVSAETPVSQG